MKTTKSITLAIAAMGALGASALADQTSTERSMNEQRVQATQPSRAGWHGQSTLASTAQSPVNFLKRTGKTIMDSPKIVTETVRGERPFLSKNGIMAQRETKGKQKVASAPSQSVANRRG